MFIFMLTVRPAERKWRSGARSAARSYDLDENGQRIPDGKGGWKNHREDTTDWNDKGNAGDLAGGMGGLIPTGHWRPPGRPALVSTTAATSGRALIKSPTVHLGPAASQHGEAAVSAPTREKLNRQIAADNKLLKEIKARITRLYNWSKAEAEKPAGPAAQHD